MFTKVVLGVAILALLSVVYVQGVVVGQQQNLIRRMMQDSNCNGSGGVVYGTTNGRS